MLVLSRKLKQQIRVGDNITITVLGVRGGAIRIGIEAPDDVRILREELPEFTEAKAGNSARPARAKTARAARTPGHSRRGDSLSAKVHTDGLRRFMNRSSDRSSPCADRTAGQEACLVK